MNQKKNSSPKALIVGVANERSIAWSIAQALHKEGVELAFTYLNDALERRVRPLAESLGVTEIYPCDVQDDDQILKLTEKLKERWGSLNYLLHAVAYAQKEDLEGRFVDTSRKGFLTALDVSAYSLVGLTRACLPLFEAAKSTLNPSCSVLTLSYYGAEKVVPNYNVMGVAKAALECSVRYLAAELGPQNIRINALSAGPVRTLAAAGIRGFKGMLQYVESKAPLRKNVSLEEIAETGWFLLSPRSGGVTGETLYVDSGYHILGM